MLHLTHISIASISAAHFNMQETLLYVVLPGFVLVVGVLAVLAIATQLIGLAFQYFEKKKTPETNPAIQAPSSMSKQEIAAVAASAHLILHSPNDPREVAAAAAASHAAGPSYRIVSIQKSN